MEIFQEISVKKSGIQRYGAISFFGTGRVEWRDDRYENLSIMQIGRQYPLKILWARILRILSCRLVHNLAIRTVKKGNLFDINTVVFSVTSVAQ